MTDYVRVRSYSRWLNYLTAIRFISEGKGLPSDSEIMERFDVSWGIVLGTISIEEELSPLDFYMYDTFKSKVAMVKTSDFDIVGEMRLSLKELENLKWKNTFRISITGDGEPVYLESLDVETGCISCTSDIKKAKVLLNDWAAKWYVSYCQRVDTTQTFKIETVM